MNTCHLRALIFLVTKLKGLNTLVSISLLFLCTRGVFYDFEKGLLIVTESYYQENDMWS